MKFEIMDLQNVAKYQQYLIILHWNTDYKDETGVKNDNKSL